MNSSEHERAQEKTRHTPECPEQPGIFFGVVVSRMRQITREAPAGSGVTLLACWNDVVVTQMRASVTHPKNIVRPVTIVALCRFRVSQLGNLAVVGVKIRLGDLLMTAPAFRHDVELEPLHIGAPDRVSGVAIVAYGQVLLAFSSHGGMNALHELLLYAVMTPSTRRRHIFRIHT